MPGKPDESLFRQKSPETVQSPEALNRYLCTISPGYWLVLSAVIVLLAGAVLWGVFSHIRVTAKVAVQVENGESVCYVPLIEEENVLSCGVISLEGGEYRINPAAERRRIIIPEGVSASLLDAGDFSAGDPVVLLLLDTGLEDGIYSGTALIEELTPISLLQ